MKIFKKALAAVTASIMTASACIIDVGSLGTVDAADMTAVELVEAMGQGWNLGNTFDSSNTWDNPLTPEKLETAWGNPVTTEAMIKEIKKSGFQTIRIPINWNQMCSADGSTINADWVTRIKEVIGYCLDNGLYVIINTHHDESWIQTDQNRTKFTNLWKAIAENFSEYDQRVVFEGTNECAFASDNTQMTYNQLFVDTVRATGGKNKTRLLLVPANNNNTDKALSNSFSAPTDSSKMVAVSVHYYEPTNFCVSDNPNNTSWYTSSWGTNNDYTKLEKHLDDLETKFIKNGIPVIIGEYGVVTKTTAKKDSESSKKFLTEVVNYALGKDGMCPVLWDMSVQGTIGSNEGDMYYFNRRSLSWYDDDIMNIFMNAGNAGGNDKTKTDRITFNAADIADDSDLLIDLKPYKGLGITVNSVVISYDLSFTGKSSTSYGAGGAVQYNILDKGEHWAYQNYNFTTGANAVTVDIPETTEVTDDDGNTFSGPLDMDYIKISNWWYWTDPEGEEKLVSHKYNKVTVIFSDYFYTDNTDDPGETPPAVTTTAAPGPSVVTTTTAAPYVPGSFTPDTDADGYAYFIGMLGADSIWGLDDIDPDYMAPVNIKGDGQYSVKWNLENGGTDTIQFLAVQLNPNGLAETFTTDTFEDLSITLDKVIVNGKEIADYTASSKAINTRYYDKDNPGVSRIYLHDDWGTGVADLPGDTVISTSIEVVFTVSGLAAESKYLAGDANGDEAVTIADATAILQHLGNKDRFGLSDQGIINADVDGSPGISTMDAIIIQQVDAKLLTADELPLAG